MPNTETTRKRLPKIVDNASKEREPLAAVEVNHTPEAAVAFLTKAIRNAAQKGKGLEDGKFSATLIKGNLKIYADED